MTDHAPTAQAAMQELPDFNSPEVQAVYQTLCCAPPPPNGQHWEGWVSRHIVLALSKLPLEQMLHELVSKIDTGLDTGDLLQDARRSSTVLDAIMTGGDLVACAHTFFKECGEDKWRDRYERSLDFRLGWNACLDAIEEARAKRASLASAPVAGEARRPVAWENFPAYLIDHCEGDTISEEGIQRALSRMLADPKYTAPQASEDPK